MPSDTHPSNALTVIPDAPPPAVSTVEFDAAATELGLVNITGAKIKATAKVGEFAKSQGLHISLGSITMSIDGLNWAAEEMRAIISNNGEGALDSKEKVAALKVYADLEKVRGENVAHFSKIAQTQASLDKANRPKPKFSSGQNVQINIATPTPPPVAVKDIPI